MKLRGGFDNPQDSDDSTRITLDYGLQDCGGSALNPNLTPSAQSTPAPPQDQHRPSPAASALGHRASDGVVPRPSILRQAQHSGWPGCKVPTGTRRLSASLVWLRRGLARIGLASGSARDTAPGRIALIAPTGPNPPNPEHHLTHPTVPTPPTATLQSCESPCHCA